MKDPLDQIIEARTLVRVAASSGGYPKHISRPLDRIRRELDALIEEIVALPRPD